MTLLAQVGVDLQSLRMLVARIEWNFELFPELNQQRNAVIFGIKIVKFDVRAQKVGKYELESQASKTQIGPADLHTHTHTHTIINNSHKNLPCVQSATQDAVRGGGSVCPPPSTVLGRRGLIRLIV